MTKFKVGDKVKYAFGGSNNVFVVVRVRGGEAYVAPEGIGMGPDDGVPAKDTELSALPKSAHNSAGQNEVVAIASSNPVVANAIAWRAKNAVDPRMLKAYDRYVKAKAAYDKWFTPDRRLSESSRQSKELFDAEKDVWKTYREIYGRPIPGGWDEPGRLKSIIESAGK